MRWWVWVLGGAGALGVMALRSNLVRAAEARESLERRVQAIEAALREYGIGPPVGWTDEVDRKLVELERQSSVLASKVGELGGRLDMHDSRIYELRGAVAALQATASELRHDVDANASGIASLDDRVGAIGERLARVEALLKWVYRKLERIQKWLPPPYRMPPPPWAEAWAERRD